MKQLVYILKHCGPDDLILADELGSGTDPAEGSAIAIAILDSLYQKESYVMVTTHYNDLKTTPTTRRVLKTATSNSIWKR